MHYYSFKNNLIVCHHNINYYNNIKPTDFKKVSEDYCCNFNGKVFVLFKLNPLNSRRSFCINNEKLLYLKEETLDILKESSKDYNSPNWLISKIKEGKATGINTEYPNWDDSLNYNFLPLCNNKSHLNINVVGLGDVGGTLITGLRLLGGEFINKIGIYDKDINKIKRWDFECNAIASADTTLNFPTIIPLEEKDLFNCDIFVFCVSVGVPKVGDEKEDVRITQFRGNHNIIEFYAKLARKNNFKGIFAVVSDPVDLLCKSVFQFSNINSDGYWDFKGLAPEQIRGYGLGVMNGRALYYSKDIAPEYKTEGRAFGPHGEGLFIANSINNYNEQSSLLLTEKTKKANLKIRAVGFKPYIAPALSSGAISILDTLRGNWNYSATFIGGNFFGCKNRLTDAGLEVETLPLPYEIFTKLQETYVLLQNTYSSITKN
ncbi:lactate dehydrogenase [Haloimpatiens massiliensis]|uniref:lactate dehydrogenase n=1 Tax=Haloimpatiens massiliensis TaxID=1658110 RepID=UPI000C8448A5|nr:lactate dehydrogenase [Haloimpatiens massiliensis]